LELLTPGARRMLVCVTDFVLSLGNFCAKRAKEAEVERGVLSLGRGCVVLERGFRHTV
jgi:hypothetical protein